MRERDAVMPLGSTVSRRVPLAACLPVPLLQNTSVRIGHSSFAPPLPSPIGARAHASGLRGAGRYYGEQPWAAR